MINVYAHYFVNDKNPDIRIYDCKSASDCHAIMFNNGNLTINLKQSQLSFLTETLVNYLASLENPKPDFDIELKSADESSRQSE